MHKSLVVWEWAEYQFSLPLLEQSKILEQINDQQHDLEITNKLMEQKGKEVQQAQTEGDMVKAKRLNAEFLELKRKQAAILAFVENLNQNALFTTYTKFASLDDLYNPHYSLADNQITIEEYNPTKWEQAKPYVISGVGITSLVLIGYFVYKWLVKRFID